MIYKRLLTVFSSLLVVLIIGSCATTANYEKMLDTWVGSDVDRLVSVWGPPQSVWHSTDGTVMIEYVREGSLDVPGYTTYSTLTTPVYSSYGGQYIGYSTTQVPQYNPGFKIPLSCRTRFRISSNGKIISWSWQGNNCVAPPLEQETARITPPEPIESKTKHDEVKWYSLEPPGTGPPHTERSKKLERLKRMGIEADWVKEDIPQ